MIPTMILFGLVFGRWWKSAIGAAAVVWPVVLVSTGVLDDSAVAPVSTVAAGAVLGAVNTAVGVGVHQLVLWVVRAVRNRARRPAA